MNLFFFVCGSLVLILSSNLAIEIRPMISRSRVYRTLPHTFASFSAKARKTKSFVQSAAAGYDHLEVERRWQQYWDDNEIFVSKRRKGHPKKYVLDMFPYPSGSGLHVGHPEGYTATDIMARYWRMCGFDVLHPMGWDAFGLPAEQHAINTGTHPAVTTHDNIATFKRQLKSLGFSYDWSRELSTTDDDYVRWTQWIFLQLFHRGLAAQSEISVNWCPALGTVLANEEIINGLSERGSHPVVRQPLRQWVLKITEYADKLEEGLVGLNWPEGTLSAQKQWIGKSQGASVKFKVDASTLDISYKDKAKNVHSNSKLSEGAFAESCGRIESIEVFTTRADTLMGVTYLVLAPEHPLVAQLTSDAQRSAVHAYLASTAGKSDLERTSVGRDRGKTGVSLGSCARHPLTGQPVPIWIADYVLASYGTGAVMAVPAHDERDFEFASIFGLDIKQVVMPVPSQVEDVSSASASTDSAAAPELQLPYTGAGVTVNSGDEFNGLDSASCQQAVMRKLSDVGAGGPTITYKLRDWVFSRQRYWGEPIPIYFPVEMLTVDGSGSPVEGAQHRICYEQPIPVPEAELPLRLPDMTDFQPGSDPQGCLSRATHWRYFQQDGKWFARETNTMPQWAGSCWYYLRFADPRNTQELIGAEGRSWLPVDLYVGGQEHAVLHLLYARFWHKALYDAGVVDHPEPFTRLVHQGMILGGDGEKMSKSRGNVINPDDVVQQYGADALRLYEMFMGPLEAVKPWQTEQLMGVVRFRDKVLGLAGGPVKEAAAEGNVLREMHRTIKKVTQDIERLGFNTAISNLMIFANLLISVRKGSNTGAVREEGPSEVPPREAVEALVLLLSPFAPHAAEECWRMLGHTQSLTHFPWPQYIEELCKESTATVVLQVNGKVRGKLDAAKDAPLESLLKEALLQPSVARFTEGMQIKKKIYVPGKVLNLIV